jgi:O-Antigen ligase
MQLNKYLPIAFIYFFINSVGLPFGLTYMTLLGPLFYVWVLLKRKKEVLLPFLAVLFPFLAVHLFVTGVEVSTYVISILNIILVYFFCQAAYTFFKMPVDHEYVLSKILVINFGFCIAALVFYFTPYSHWFWIRQDLTSGVDDFLRLRLFTYEASYYAMLFIPVFVFFFLQYMFRQNKLNSTLLIVMIFLPLVLSFSLGVIACLVVAMLVVLLLYAGKLIVKPRVLNFFITGSVLAVICLLIVFMFFRDNVFFQRLTNFFAGEDTSGKGRIQDAFMLASRIMGDNAYWGIGPGQLNEVGADIIRSHYLYFHNEPVAIPNATAETLLLFGWVGLFLRIFIEVFLFFYTRVWSNYYRLVLFFFIFLYQFTGSFITNGVEYVTWILAFTNCFPQFDAAYRTSTLRMRPVS